MKLAHIPYDQLKISPQNMRDGRKAPDISDIFPSIRERGILVPLLVRPNGKGYEIVAGRRRYYSARKAAGSDKEVKPLPCAIMEQGDDAAALEASLLENTARLDPDEMTRFETFAKLIKEGKTTTQIADTFGVTEIMVKRSLALGNLIPPIRNAYRAEDIDARTIRLLTLATTKQQKDWYKLFKDPKQRAPHAHHLKEWLFGGEIQTDKALFPLDRYKGQIISDLFGEESYFDNAAEFWQLQNAAIAAKRDTLLEAGWSEVTVLDIGRYFCEWEHVKTTKKDGGCVFVQVAANGEATFYEGYITKKEHHARIHAKAGSKDATQATARPELTKAAQNYVSLHRHAAVRASLLNAPAIALRLMVTHAIVGSGNWRTQPDAQEADKETTSESIATSVSQTTFETEKKEVLKLLKLPTHQHSVTQSNCDTERAGRLFLALLELDDQTVMRILTFIMAETLESGTPMIELLGGKLSVDMKDCWRPDDAFYDLLRDKTAINAMLKHIGGKQVADANVSATAKAQKKIIADFVTGEGRKKTEGWLPHYMEFPFKAYTKNGGGLLTANAQEANAVSR